MDFLFNSLISILIPVLFICLLIQMFLNATSSLCSCVYWSQHCQERFLDSSFSIFFPSFQQVSRGILSGVLQGFSSSPARVSTRVCASYRSCVAFCCSHGVCTDTWAPRLNAAWSSAYAWARCDCCAPCWRSCSAGELSNSGTLALPTFWWRSTW